MHWMKKLGLAASLAFVSSGAAQAQEGRGDVVYVPTPQIVVDEMLRMAKIGPNDYLIDLGSGDGRFVITAAKKFGARGFGVDLDTYLLRIARESARPRKASRSVRASSKRTFSTPISPRRRSFRLICCRR